LAISPALRALLAALKLASGGEGLVFGLSKDEANSGAKRLVGKIKVRPHTGTKRKMRRAQLPASYGAPERFTWQVLRSTTATYLTNAPGIFGASSAYRSAKQLGHSVTVAEKNYLDLLRGISPTARTVEAAMQIEAEMREIIARVSTPKTPHTTAQSVRDLRSPAS
jgi:hypothetical protein